MGINLNAHGYADAKTATPGEFVKLPPGGYVCTVVMAEIVYAKSGKPMLALYLDITEGDFSGYFTDATKRSRNFKPDLRWDNGGTFRQNIFNLDNKTSPFFKGLITTLLNGNPNVKVNFEDFDPTCFFGATLGMVFAEEAYDFNGKSGFRVTPKIPKLAEDIRSGNFKVPEPKSKPAQDAPPAKNDFGDTPVEPDDTPF